MNDWRIFQLLFCTTAFGCENAATPAPSAEPAVARPAAAKKTYGAPPGAAETVPLRAVLAQPEQYKDQSVIVDGAVRQACSRRGCWMEIAEGLDKSLPGCRVTFKDYGFFVPTDSQGSKARVAGAVGVRTVEASVVEHMEQEGAHFASKNPDGSANEVRLVATGVELTRLDP